MALDTAGDANAITGNITGFINTKANASNSYIDNISAILDAGFQKATPTEANVDISPPAGSLLIVVGAAGTMPEVIGQACADYWVKAIAPASPQHQLSISKVVNDAAKIAAPIAANLRALPGRGYLLPSYFDFVNAIHKEVKAIIWKVTEKDALGIASTYPVKVT